MPERSEADRLMDGLMDVVLEGGWEGADEDAIARRAGLQRADFDRHFRGVADCYEQTYERNYSRFEHIVFDAYAGLAWRDSLRGSAYAAARYLRDHHDEVRFGAVPTAEGSEVVVASRDLAFQRLTDLIDAGRHEMDDPHSVSRSVAEGVIGAIYETLVRRTGQGEGTGSAEAFVPEMMYLAVRPYLGHEVAKEELTIPAPPEPVADA